MTKRLTPIKRRKLVQGLTALGFEGPFPGGKHEFMIRGICRVRLPNPHQTDISVDLLRRILKEAGITREEWLRTDD